MGKRGQAQDVEYFSAAVPPSDSVARGGEDVSTTSISSSLPSVSDKRVLCSVAEAITDDDLCCCSVASGEMMEVNFVAFILYILCLCRKDSFIDRVGPVESQYLTTSDIPKDIVVYMPNGKKMQLPTI